MVLAPLAAGLAAAVALGVPLVYPPMARWALRHKMLIRVLSGGLPIASLVLMGVHGLLPQGWWLALAAASGSALLVAAVALDYTALGTEAEPDLQCHGDFQLHSHKHH